MVAEAFDPPFVEDLYWVPRHGESYVKEFHPLNLGTIELPKGRGLLELRAVRVPGRQVMDVRAVTLRLMDRGD